jgi:hypothetical protein
MNKLMADVMAVLPPGTNLITTLMVIDYVVCTTPISPGEEVEVLTVLLELSKLLGLVWGPAFDSETVAMAIEGKVPSKGGGVVDKGVSTTHRMLCSKRAALYRENQPSICDMADTVRPMLHG